MFRSPLFRCKATFLYGIDLKYGRTALRWIRRHERCSCKLARYANNLTFLTRCIKNHTVPKDLQIWPPVPTKGARRVAEVAFRRFLRERIRLTQRARRDVKREAKSTAQSITSGLSAEDAAEVLDNIRSNTQKVFNTTKDHQQRKFEKLLREKRASVFRTRTPYVDKAKWILICHLGP